MPSDTRAETTVVGTRAGCHPAAPAPGRESTSPGELTCAEDWRNQPSASSTRRSPARATLVAPPAITAEPTRAKAASCQSPHARLRSFVVDRLRSPARRRVNREHSRARWRSARQHPFSDIVRGRDDHPSPPEPARRDRPRPARQRAAVLAAPRARRGQRLPGLRRGGRQRRPARADGRRPGGAPALDVLGGRPADAGRGPPHGGRPAPRLADGAVLGRRARRHLLDARLHRSADSRLGSRPTRSRLRPTRSPSTTSRQAGPTRSTRRSRSSARSRNVPPTAFWAATSRRAAETGARSRTCG